MANFPPGKTYKGSTFLIVVFLGVVAFGLLMGIGTFVVGHLFAPTTTTIPIKKS